MRLRCQVLFVLLGFLPLVNTSFSQSSVDPNVVFSIEEWAHWASVLGADASAFTLYDNRDLIYFNRQVGRYEYVQLTEGEYARILEDVIPKDLPMFADRYDRVWVTCQNVYYFYFGGDRPRMVSVYGHPTTDIDFGGKERVYEIPHSLRRCFNTIERYQNSRAVHWVPEKIEVLVWDPFPTDEEYLAWPDEWPDLNSPETIRRPSVSSVFLPRELYDEFMALLEESKGIVMMNAQPMVISYRMPIPGEEVFAWSPEEPEYECTPLHEAARRGNLETMKSLIETGADMNAQDSRGWTPLHVAVGTGRWEIAEYLLANDADANVQSHNGRTPLHLAAEWGEDDVLELLLTHDADIEVRMHEGRTALHAAAEWGQASKAALLVAHGADVEARTVYGNTPLLCSLDFREPNVATLLLASGADPCASNDANDAGLHYATDDVLIPVAEQLIVAGLDVNVANDAGETPLYGAARDGALQIVELLLVHGADPHATKPDGRTSLHAAAFQGHAAIVDLLMAHGADVYAETTEEQTPLDYAISAGRTDVVGLLTNAPVKP